MKKKTTDGLVVYYRDDHIYGVLGYKLPGVSLRAVTRREGELFMLDVEKHSRSELEVLWKAAQKTARRAGTDEDFRREVLVELAPQLPPMVLVSADRNGKPLERHGRYRVGPLQSVAIIWTKGQGYEVGYADQDGVFLTSGLTYTNRKDLRLHLAELRELNA